MISINIGQLGVEAAPTDVVISNCCPLFTLFQLNSTLETQLGVLQSSLDGQMSSLRQTVLDKEASDISEAMAQVKNSSGKQIEAAREQWLKEVVCVCVSVCLSSSLSVCLSVKDPYGYRQT